MYNCDEEIYIKNENDFYSIKSPDRIKKIFFCYECDFEMPNIDAFINIEELSYNCTVSWEYISKLRLPYIKKLYFVVYETKFLGKIEMPTLEKLKIRVEKFRDLTPLEMLIEMNEKNEKNENIDFSGFPNLKELELFGWCNIDLRSILVLSNLKSLILSFCQLRDITEIGKIETLEYLCLDNNEIENIEALLNLKKLKKLILSYNFIKDATVLRCLDNLTEVDLYRNRIEDDSSLRGIKSTKLIITKADKDEEMKKWRLENLSGRYKK